MNKGRLEVSSYFKLTYRPTLTRERVMGMKHFHGADQCNGDANQLVKQSLKLELQWEYSLLWRPVVVYVHRTIETVSSRQM